MEADLERRFGGLRRLWGDEAYARLRGASVGVVGVGGVGSWAAEALARCGVAELLLVDLDQVAESNINRQVQALGATVGAAKVDALRARIADIHPGCQVRVVEDFVEPDRFPQMLPVRPQVLIDACDDRQAKRAMARWALAGPHALVMVGAAGGKSEVQRIDLADLADVTHDPLLGRLRRQLRQEGLAPASGPIGLRCVFSRETVQQPDSSCSTDGSLNCHGYGSCVMVTASFGMAAAAEAVRLIRTGAA
ncbi:tRNA threonylcarbamoyladenosine dehydratase [Sphaerotilus hippei]|nr:ThiF family adenylyltransferase [Sphaerotilus hippei]